MLFCWPVFSDYVLISFDHRGPRGRAVWVGGGGGEVSLTGAADHNGSDHVTE